MAMDLTVTDYATYADLLDYMDGSAAVIGTMMLPILDSTDRAAAREPARQLGLAFQLTNFIRDVAEDLDRGRVYLPAEDLAAFEVTPVDLERARMAGTSNDKIRELIAFEVQRARAHYRAAVPGIALLAPSSQGCIRAAYHIYGGILDEIAGQGFDVFTGRATVPNRRRLALAVRSLLARPGAPVTLPGPEADPALTPRAAALARSLDPTVVPAPRLGSAERVSS
jgi:phytoene synthase